MVPRVYYSSALQSCTKLYYVVLRTTLYAMLRYTVLRPRAADRLLTIVLPRRLLKDPAARARCLHVRTWPDVGGRRGPTARVIVLQVAHLAVGKGSNRKGPRIVLQVAHLAVEKGSDRKGMVLQVAHSAVERVERKGPFGPGPENEGRTYPNGRHGRKGGVRSLGCVCA